MNVSLCTNYSPGFHQGSKSTAPGSTWSPQGPCNPLRHSITGGIRVNRKKCFDYGAVVSDNSGCPHHKQRTSFNKLLGILLHDGFHSCARGRYCNKHSFSPELSSQFGVHAPQRKLQNKAVGHQAPPWLIFQVIQVSQSMNAGGPETLPQRFAHPNLAREAFSTSWRHR